MNTLLKFASYVLFWCASAQCLNAAVISASVQCAGEAPQTLEISTTNEVQLRCGSDYAVVVPGYSVQGPTAIAFDGAYASVAWTADVQILFEGDAGAGLMQPCLSLASGLAKAGPAGRAYSIASIGGFRAALGPTYPTSRTNTTVCGGPETFQPFQVNVPFSVQLQAFAAAEDNAFTSVQLFDFRPLQLNGDPLLVGFGAIDITPADRVIDRTAFLPEPGTYAMTGAALLAVAGWRRRLAHASRKTCDHY